MDRMENVFGTFHIGIVIAIFLLNSKRILKAIEISKECLFMVNINCKNMGKENDLIRIMYLAVYKVMLDAYELISDHTSAIECATKMLVLSRETGERYREGTLSLKLGQLYQKQNKHEKAKQLYMNALRITTKTRDKNLEGACYGNLGTVFYFLAKYDQAEEYLRKELQIRIEIGDKKGAASAYENLGTVFWCLGKYDTAQEYHEKALQIRIEIGDKEGKASVYVNLGSVFQCLGKYVKAQEYLQKALQIVIENGDKKGEASAYGNLGTVFQSLGKYDKAQEYHEKALQILIEIGDKKGEASACGNLGNVFRCLGKYDKAKEHLQKALQIVIEIGDKKGEATAYGNLGNVFRCLGKFDTAEEYLQKALQILIEIGDKKGEGAAYENLGSIFQCLGKYDKAQEYLQKALQILIEIGDKQVEASAYGHLGTVFQSLGKYDKAEEYYEKALQIRIEIGDKKGEASAYGNLGSVFQSLGKYDKAQEHLQKALQIRIQIGDKEGVAVDYGNLGNVFYYLGKYDKAEEYLRKALQIRIDIGDKEGEAADYGNLGSLYFSFGEYSKAKAFHEKALSLANKIGHIELQFSSYLSLSWLIFFVTGNIDETISSLIKSIAKSEEMQTFLRNNDDFKICSLDMHVSPYKLLSALFCANGNFNEALYVAEIARARGLADMMSAQYCVEHEISGNPQSWVGIERIMRKEIDSACLYVSHWGKYLFLWIVKKNKLVVFRRKDINDCFSVNGARDVDEVFGDISLRNASILLTQEHCEDRSLFSLNADCLSPSRPLEEDEDEDQYHQPPTLNQYYKMIIDPVTDLLDQPEIIIVPEGPLYKVPFAALKDENEKYLSESFRIRIVPSLTTLKLIQDSPADYHSQTGALIVGDPKVGVVFYKGSPERIRPLPCAREEAEMIGRLLGVKPLIGEHPTKQAVLTNMPSVSLIHFAAHGDAERGEIALAPPQPFNGTPQETDYLLTMAEIARVRLRAKLVVLSCCHSAKGQIRSEGVVGIARAFLGSGARSVLVALWAIEDEATMKFMSRFYEHLVDGVSASESLHQAMKWMRSHGFSDVEQWAPFMLIGDNVTFDFRKERCFTVDRS